MSPTIGILGGMGPEATAYFFSLIIKNTEARKDQDHIPALIYSNPKIPPRTTAILEGGENPAPYLLRGIELLEKAGADFVVIPCITAHYFLPEILPRVKIPLVSLLEETSTFIQKNFPGLGRVGLLASSGTLAARLFPETLGQTGVVVLEPHPDEQKKVMEAIFGKKGIKAGYTSVAPRKILKEIAIKLIARGAEAIIAGCTEVPLSLREKDLPVPLLDPMGIAALACIKKAGYKVK